MAQSNYIEFRQLRSFSEKFSATFDFVKISFKPLGTALLLIAGPMVALSAIGYVLYLQSFTEFITTAMNNPSDFPFEMIGYVGLFTLVSVLAYFFVISTTLEYINIYLEKKSPDISASEIWDRVRDSSFNVIIAGIVLGIIYVAIVGVSVGFFAISIVGLPLIGLLTFPIMMVIIIYFSIVFSLFFNILINEKRGVGDFGIVINRCFKLIRGKWWSTFGLLFISSLLLGLVGALLSAPAGAMQIGQLFESIQNPESFDESMYMPSKGVIIYNGFVVFIRSLLQAFVIIALSFQYFNLVERNEAAGLVGKISGIQTSNESTYGSEKTGDSEENEDY